MTKLDLERFRKEAKYNRFRKNIPALQLVVFVMCGGGFLGEAAARRPADFFIDKRVGKLPYSRKEIYQAVEVLKILAKVSGADPCDLPPLMDFHRCGIF